MRHFRNERGITLMELTIVAVITGIAAALTLPSFFEVIPRMQARAEVRNIVSALREARSLAIASKQPHGVAVDYTNGAIIVFLDTDSPEMKYYTAGDSVIVQAKVGNDVSLAYDTFNNSSVVFEPDGSASCSGEMCITTDDNRNYYYLSVLAATGRVRLEEGREYHVDGF